MNGIDHNSITHFPKRPKLSDSFISPTEIQSEFSHHSPSVARINNGSFGCCPKSIISAQKKSRLVIKDLVNADHVDEISIVDNATTAAAIVLQSVSWGFSQGRFEKGDACVMLHYAYGAVKKSVEAYVTRVGGFVIEVQLPFPVSSVDEVVSDVVIPVKELVKICREEGVDQVFVDAAHGIGCIDVDMKEIGADFYTSNLHKWFFCPPSVAFLYCRKANECNDLHHPVVSHEYGNGLAIESAWIGTRDYSAQLVVPQVLEFVNRFEGGIEGIKKRNHEGVVAMGEMLANAWGTHLGSPPEMCASMIMVGLPACLGISCESDTQKLRTRLRDKFSVEVPIYYRPQRDGEVDTITGYARISHQVYNKPDDYYKFRDAINELVNEGFTCALFS
ncbi:hypothetical protein Patl1_23892 [Pistacia atlantica]|uniref:Uncharacterized protein n=1 Tax=Pistacia atlantica TaxID=434234 RepID=A0ACC1A1X8_9ROSI|nr:hypothetical protein Patl1_23892 [Pistacia atlantica]